MGLYTIWLNDVSLRRVSLVSSLVTVIKVNGNVFIKSYLWIESIWYKDWSWTFELNFTEQKRDSDIIMLPQWLSKQLDFKYSWHVECWWKWFRFIGVFIFSWSLWVLIQNHNFIHQLNLFDLNTMLNKFCAKLSKGANWIQDRDSVLLINYVILIYLNLTN